MKQLKHLFILLVSLVSTTVIHAQGNKSDFGELMRSNGRIYVVIAVMLTILASLILYLVRLDRKISNLEKEN
ncbi:MAG: CcmD family protein [Bacteroidota bacterium]